MRKCKTGAWTCSEVAADTVMTLAMPMVLGSTTVTTRVGVGGWKRVEKWVDAHTSARLTTHKHALALRFC